MLMDEVSHSFHQSGHSVRMLLQLGNPVIKGELGRMETSTSHRSCCFTFVLRISGCDEAEGSTCRCTCSSTCKRVAVVGVIVVVGFEYAGRPNSYELSTWSPGDNYIEEYNGWFFVQQKEFLLGR